MTTRRKPLDLEHVIKPDNLAVGIANKYIEWELFRAKKISQWDEIQKYIFATSTRDTTNSKLPWKNSTTLPKLCQIRDNLHANYMATLFPKRKWLTWQGDKQEDEVKAKKDSIESYMLWSFERSGFYDEMSKVVLDYIDYGNCFVMPYWKDDRVLTKDGKTSIGYVGPAIKRISPLDIVFDPTASSFVNAPKIVRSFKSWGEIKTMLESIGTTDEEKQAAQDLWNYMNEYRAALNNYNGTVNSKDQIYNVAGFSNFRDYANCGHVEVLTFYGDLYDPESNTLLQNHVIKVIDRHKILVKAPHDSAFGFAPIFHAGWRIRPDNLWAMGPLDNIVGLQYRIDHIENMKADLIDLTTFPLIKRRGYVEDFEYAPMEHIILGDDGEVDLLAPSINHVTQDSQIAYYEQKMEEMAGSPKEAMGFRTPGEKTMYEVQRLEMAAGRIFQSKVGQFEQQLVEPSVNGMLELSHRHLDRVTVRAFNSEFKVATFTELTQEDITGQGILKPVAARHFAEQANRVQNLHAFLSSPAGMDPMVQVHFSAERLARMWEELLELEDYHIVQPFVRIAEQADQMRQTQAMQEQVAVEQQTPTGMYPGDHDPEVESEPVPTPDEVVGPS